jgi:hypothetical protein
MKPYLVIALCLLSGCSWIGRQADALGSYMPVVGERCEHWQCMGEEGQVISDANKDQRLKQEEKEREAEEAAAHKAESDAADRKPLLEQIKP